MFLFSSTVESFLTNVRKWAREIMIQEMGINFGTRRFSYRGYSIPLVFVVFEKKNVLGYYDARFNQIGLNKVLMYQAKDLIIKDVIRHELAHLIVFQEYGYSVPDHGVHFKNVCEKYGWGNNIMLAKENLEVRNNDIEGDLQAEKIITKVKKLLQLASSQNRHESELATLKANQMLLKHNLNKFNYEKEINEELCINKVLEAKRNNSKLKTISTILKSFLVHPVFNYGKGIVNLEVTGSRENVQIASYVADFLNYELDFLWKKAQKENNSLKGITKKNSFFYGVSQGYLSKIEKMTQQDLKNSKSLILINKYLQKKSSRFYHSLSGIGSSTRHCNDSHQLGHAAGKSLNIRPGIKSQGTTYLLS